MLPTPSWFTTPVRYVKRAFPWAAVYLLLFLGISLFIDIVPLSYTPAQLDLAHLYQPPLQWATYDSQQPFHWLGTDQLGRDVLINLLYGCRTALLVSLPAMFLAVTIGLGLGGLAGYFGDRHWQTRRATWFAWPVPLGLGYFYAFHLRQPALHDAFVEHFLTGLGALLLSLLIFGVVVIGLSVGLARMLGRWPWFRQPTFIPIDQLVLKLIELISSVPGLVLILLFASLTRPSVLVLIIIVGLTYWTEPARLIRAEMLRIRAQSYIETARALGASDWHIWWRHALPNALPPVVVAFAFGVGRLMALESTLSFLGIGIPPDIPSWGRLINGMKSNVEAWWLVVVPGIVLCLTVLALQSIANQWLRRWRR